MRWNKLGRTRESYNRYTHTVWAVQLIVSNVRSRFSSLSACFFFCFSRTYFLLARWSYSHASQAVGSGRRAVMVIVCGWMVMGRSGHVCACGMTVMSFCKEIVGARLCSLWATTVVFSVAFIKILYLENVYWHIWKNEFFRRDIFATAGGLVLWSARHHGTTAKTPLYCLAYM